jgi:hypothetical protein
VISPDLHQTHTGRTQHNATVGALDEAKQQREQRGLAGAGAAADADFGARGNGEG